MLHRHAQVLLGRCTTLLQSESRATQTLPLLPDLSELVLGQVILALGQADHIRGLQLLPLTHLKPVVLQLSNLFRRGWINDFQLDRRQFTKVGLSELIRYKMFLPRVARLVVGH